MQEIQVRVSPEVAAQDALLRLSVARTLQMPAEQIQSLQIRKHSIDARHRRS